MIEKAERAVRQRRAVVFILAGMVLGGLAWTLLPPDRGRFQYAVSVVDPRPWPDAEMPAGLEEIRVVRRQFLRTRTAETGTVEVMGLTRPKGGDGPAHVMMVEGLAALFTPADCQAGKAATGESTALAGAASGLSRGFTQLGSRTIEISGVLEGLGPLLDEALWMEWSQPLATELAGAGWRVRVRYLLLAETWAEREQILAQLGAEPGLLPTPEAEIISPAEAPPLSDALRLVLACVMVAGGVLLLVRQLRGMFGQAAAGTLGRE